MAEFDSPWKEALDRFLPLFLEFFFPEAHQDIDWSRGYEALDKELAQIVREAETRGRLADKLFKVWRKSGDEAWVLIHIEIQAQAQSTADFAERIYTYNYRIYDRFHRPVATFAVLADDQPDWRPQQFRYHLWGTTVLLEFASVKLLDYEGRQTELEQHENPFALVALAHLQSIATRNDAVDRRDGKLRLIKILLTRGLSAQDIRQLFRVIDWMLDLPEELSQSFWDEVQRFEKEMQMPVFTSTEKYLISKGRVEGREEGREEGRREGRQEGKREALVEGISDWLKQRFGKEGAALVPKVQEIKSLAKLRSLQQALWNTDSLEKAQALIAPPKARKR